MAMGLIGLLYITIYIGDAHFLYKRPRAKRAIGAPHGLYVYKSMDYEEASSVLSMSILIWPIGSVG